MDLDYPMIYIIRSGGPVMIALALLSVLMYQAIIGLLVFVRRVTANLEEREQFETEFSDRHGPTPAEETPEAGQAAAMDESLWQFQQLVRGRLKYSRALLTAAPLLGLLGTVMGMLDTFQGLSLQLGQETSRAVADGISRALITTETGLMVAIPAMFLLHWIKRDVQRYELRILQAKMQLLASSADLKHA